MEILSNSPDRPPNGPGSTSPNKKSSPQGGFSVFGDGIPQRVFAGDPTSQPPLTPPVRSYSRPLARSYSSEAQMKGPTPLQSFSMTGSEM